jgi:hypothetical protein
MTVMSSRVGAWTPRWRRELVGALVPLLLVVLLALPVALPLFQGKQISGHDAYAYPPSVVEFAQGVREGQFLPRWAPDVGGGYGLPLFNFRPPWFYGLASLFHLAGTSVITAVNLAALVLLVGSGLAMYVLVQAFFGAVAGVVAAGAYMYAPYLLFDLYRRQALSEFSTFPLIPLSFWSLARYYQAARYHQLFLSSAAIALVLLSSNPIACILLPWLMLYAFILGWRHPRGTSALRGVVPLVLGCGLSAFFWLPAIWEKDLVHLSRTVTDFFTYKNHFLAPHRSLYAGPSLYRPEYGTFIKTVSLSAISVFIVIYSLKETLTRRDDATMTVMLFIAMFILSTFLTTPLSQGLWSHMPLIAFVQFPWRFLALTSAASSVLLGYVVARIAGTPFQALIGATVVTLALLLFGLPHARPEALYAVDETTYHPATIASRNLPVDASGEHDPVWVEKGPASPAFGKLVIVQGHGRVRPLSLASTHQRFRVWIETEGARLRANTFYFPEWRIVVDEKVQAIAITKPEGLMEFSVDVGEHEVQIVFHNSAVRNYGTGLSLLSVGLLVCSPASPALRRFLR